MQYRLITQRSCDHMKEMAVVCGNSQPLIAKGGTMRVQRAARDRGSELMNFQCRVYVELLRGRPMGLATSDSYHLLCKELIWPHTL